MLEFDALSQLKITNFVDLLRYRADLTPNKTSFIFLQQGETEAARLTYRELDQQARAIAAKMQNLTNPGDRALLLYPFGLDFIAAFFGCLYAGIVAVPAAPPRRNQKMSRLEAIATDTQATVVLTTTSLLDNIKSQLAENPAFFRMQCIATNDRIVPDRDLSFPNITADSLAFLQYTSGSTGMPKGVMVSHGNLFHNLQQIQMAFEPTKKMLVASWLPLFHDMGLIGNVLQPIYLGLPCILMSPTDFLQKPFRWLQVISRYQVSISGAPNFAYDLCTAKITPEQRATLDLSSWEIAFNGAEPVRAETLDRFTETFTDCGFRREAFYPCYGMAEATLLISGGSKTTAPIINSVDGSALAQNRVVAANSQQKQNRQIVSCGQTWLDQKILIVNPQTLSQCADKEVGEIWLSGNNVAQGYWNQSRQTEDTFHAFLADTGEGKFLRTGDLGFLQDGNLFITGRLKDLIIIRGRNHYPEDIELTVGQSSPALTKYSAAFAVDVDSEERLVVVAEVERSYLRGLDVEATVKAIRKAISEEHQLQVYAVVLIKTGSIPKTSSGKVQRYACRAAFLDKSLDVVGDWIENPQSLVDFDRLPDQTESLWSQQQQQFSNENSSDEQSGEDMSVLTEEAIQDWLVSRLVLYLQVGPDEINISEPFASYGLDSAVAISITGELADWLGCKLEPTLFWEYHSIELLSEHLGREMQF